MEVSRYPKFSQDNLEDIGSVEEGVDDDDAPEDHPPGANDSPDKSAEKETPGSGP